MAKKIYIYVVIMVAFSGVFLPSCLSSDHDPDPVLSGNVEKFFPSYCVNLNVSYNTSGNYFYMTVEPHFYFKPSEWGVTIEKVAYYVDDTYIKTETNSPFSIEYESNNWYVGAHNIRADITISGENIETFILQANKVIDNSSSQEKAADVWFDYNYATTGEEFFIYGNINYKRSTSGTTVKSFTAQWDETSMGEKITSPYKLTRTISEQAGTTHSVYATLKYSQGSSEVSYSLTIPSYEIPGPKSIYPYFKLKSRYADFQNGDLLEGIARLYIGSEVKVTYGFELYLDDNLIATANSFPCDISYKLENIELGEHALKKQWVRYDEEGNKTSSFSTDEIITITK